MEYFSSYGFRELGPGLRDFESETKNGRSSIWNFEFPAVFAQETGFYNPPTDSRSVLYTWRIFANPLGRIDQPLERFGQYLATVSC